MTANGSNPAPAESADKEALARASDPTERDALDRAAHAAVGLARNSVELALLEARRAATEQVRVVALLAAAGMVAAGAWIATSVAAALALGRVVPTDAAVGIVAAFHLVLALALARVATRKNRREAT